MAIETGLTLGGEPRLHYAARQDVVFWPLRAARDAPTAAAFPDHPGGGQAPS